MYITQDISYLSYIMENLLMAAEIRSKVSNMLHSA